MNKRIVTVLASVLSAVPLYAGGMQNKTNASAEYTRSVARNASTEADAAYYNPAGIARFCDGLFANVSNQFLLKEYSHKSAAGKEWMESEPVLFFPNVQAGFKKDFWGAFLTFNIPAGGGTVNYDKGTYTTDMVISAMTASFLSQGFTSSVNEQTIKASSVYYGITLGGMVDIKKIVSVAVGGRLVLARNSSKLSANFDVSKPAGPAVLEVDYSMNSEYSEEATGFTGIFGVNLTPIKQLNIGMKFELNTPLEFEQNVETAGATVTPNAAASTVPTIVAGATTLQNAALAQVNSLAATGKKYQKDLPAALALGVSYNIIPPLMASIGFNCYFNKLADWEGYEDSVDNSLEFSAGAEFALNEKAKISAGYVYGLTGADEKNYGKMENPDLDFQSIGIGGKISPVKNLSVNLGVLGTLYKEMTSSAGSFTFNKKILIIGLGLTWAPEKVSNK